jgi:AcrR family transcriptional regulator
MTNLRERQRQLSRDAVREAALRLATEKGVGAITVADICRDAGVSPRTFFNYFRTKEDSLLPRLPEFRPEAVREFVERRDADLLGALQALLADHLRDMHAQAAAPASLERMFDLIRANPELLPGVMGAFQAFEARVADLVAQRTGRPGADLFCRIAALAATGAVRTALMESRPCESESPGFPPVVDPEILASSFAALRHLLATGAER